VSFVDPAGYFLASRVQMHNKDIIFAANAKSVQIEKFITLVNAIISVPNNFANTGVQFETWRVLSHQR
jgi:polysaccharide export outer membrane protein